MWWERDVAGAGHGDGDSGHPEGRAPEPEGEKPKPVSASASNQVHTSEGVREPIESVPTATTSGTPGAEETADTHGAAQRPQDESRATRSPGSAGAGRRRWAAWSLLVLLMGTVVAVNAEHFGRNPFPSQSMHRAFMMVPRLVRVFEGYRMRPGVVDHLDPSGKSYALPYRTPIPWTHPAELWREFEEGGRLHKLVGGCTAGFYTCMPHSFSFLALIGAAFPGHLTLVNLGITFYLLLLILSVYGIAADAGGRLAGLGAAAIAASYPAFFGYARWIEGYLPATALSVAMVWCLVRSRGLTRYGPLVAFFPLAFMAIHNGEGLSEGIGAGLAVSGPFLVTLVAGGWEALRKRRIPWKTAGGLILVAAPLLLTMDWPWLMGGLEHVFTGFDEWYVDARPVDPTAGPVMAALYSKGAYLLLVYAQYLKPLMTFWLLLAVPFFLVRPVRHKVLVLAWFLVPAMAYASMSRKAMWYALPMIPPLAVVTGLGLAAVPWRRIKVGLLILAPATGLVQFLALSLPRVHDMVPVPLYLQQPIPPRHIAMRQSRLIGPVTPDLMMLHDRMRRFLTYLDQTVPRDDTLKYVAVATNWGEDIYLAQVFAYAVSLTRPDLEVVPLAEPMFVESAPFSGLEPRFFKYYLRIDRSGEFVSCTDKWGRAIVSNPEQPAHAPPALQRFADQLVRRARGTLPNLPAVLVLK